jgi:hypothetical protein
VSKQALDAERQELKKEAALGVDTGRQLLDRPAQCWAPPASAQNVCLPSDRRIPEQPAHHLVTTSGYQPQSLTVVGIRLVPVGLTSDGRVKQQLAHRLVATPGSLPQSMAVLGICPGSGGGAGKEGAGPSSGTSAAHAPRCIPDEAKERGGGR